MTPYIRE